MKFVVFPDLLKAHIKGFTRKDGAFVPEHDDSRPAAAPKQASGLAHGGGKDAAKIAAAKHAKDNGAKGAALVQDSPEDAASVSKMWKEYSPDTAVVSHPDHGFHVVVTGKGDAKRMQKNGYQVVSGPTGGGAAKAPENKPTAAPIKQQPAPPQQQPKPAASPPKLVVTAPKPAAAPPKPASAPPAANSQPKPTGSAAPAKLTNIGGAEYPLHVKTSQKLDANMANGATHHIGGFKSPVSNGMYTSGGDTRIHHDGSVYHHVPTSPQKLDSGETAHEYQSADDEYRSVMVTNSGHLIDENL